MIDPNISLQVKPLQLDSPLDSAGKAQSLRSLMLHNQGIEDEYGRQTNLRSLMSSADPNDPKSLTRLLMNAGFGKEALAWDKDAMANQESELKVKKQKLDLVGQHHQIASQTFNSLGPNPSLEQVGQAAQFLQSKGIEIDMRDAPKSQEEVPGWIQQVTTRGQSVGEQLTAAQQQWDRNYKEHQQRWEMNKPQSEYGKVVADTQRMDSPDFRSFDAGGSKLNAMAPTSNLASLAPSSSGGPAGNALPGRPPRSVDAQSGALVSPLSTGQVPEPMPIQSTDENAPIASAPQEGNMRDQGQIARWHASGGKAPEGTVPYVENGDVKFRVDPAWLQAKTAVAKAGAANINAAGGDIALGKQAATKVDEGLLDTTGRIMRLDRIQNQYKPEFQQTMPRLSNAWTAIKERAGVNVSGEDQKKLAEFSQYKRTSIENLNQYIKETTGAAMSEAEAVRLRQAMPDPGDSWYNGDSPTQFKSKMDDVVRSLKMAEARLVHIKRNGLSMESIPLEKMPEIINQRGAQLEKQLAKSGTNKAEVASVVRRQLAQEFGLIYK